MTLEEKAKQDIHIVGTRPVKKVPGPRGRSGSPYKFLEKAVATLGPDEALELKLPLEKKYRVPLIRNALRKAFPNTKINVTERTLPGGEFVRVFIHHSKS